MLSAGEAGPSLGPMKALYLPISSSNNSRTRNGTTMIWISSSASATIRKNGSTSACSKEGSPGDELSPLLDQRKDVASPVVSRVAEKRENG